MEFEQTFTLRTNERRGFDVEVWSHEGRVWLNLDPNSSNDEGAHQRLTAEQARELAAALVRFADKV